MTPDQSFFRWKWEHESGERPDRHGWRRFGATSWKMYGVRAVELSSVARTENRRPDFLTRRRAEFFTAEKTRRRRESGSPVNNLGSASLRWTVVGRPYTPAVCSKIRWHKRRHARDVVADHAMGAARRLARPEYGWGSRRGAPGRTQERRRSWPSSRWRLRQFRRGVDSGVQEALKLRRWRRLRVKAAMRRGRRARHPRRRPPPGGRFRACLR